MDPGATQQRGMQWGQSDRKDAARHCVGVHILCEEGVDSDGVGWSKLPVKRNRHRATYTQAQHESPLNLQKIRRRRKKRRRRTRHGLAREAARLHRAKPQGALSGLLPTTCELPAAKGANGWGHDHGVLCEATKQGAGFVGMLETRRARRTWFSAAGFRVFFCCGSDAGGQHREGVAFKASICRSSAYNAVR